ncbi:MAG: hypothetical protein QG639_397 [Patescibacteria group bacterium]|nr:hypothetical protein [Patescibacteria group bacterium]
MRFLSTERENMFVINVSTHETPSPFYESFLQQLEIQSGVGESTSDSSGSHPDPLIRKCLEGLLLSLTFRKNHQLAAMFQSLSDEEKHLEPTHMADLVARAVQYIFRSKDDSSYMQFTLDDWHKFFQSLSEMEINQLREIVLSREVATHVLARYRGFAALNFLYSQQISRPLRVGDIGCSLNYGLQATVTGGVWQPGVDSLNDMSRDQLLLNSLQAKTPPYEYALGIDIQEPDFDWVAACAYFSKYDDNKNMLGKYKTLVEDNQNSGIPVHTMVGDISHPGIIDTIRRQHTPNFHLMYGSMVLYQLSSEMRERALQNISNLLGTNGMFVELSFRNPDNWFLPWNTITSIRFKEGTELSRPFDWVEWDSSRCLQVKESQDFDEVNLRMANLREAD